MNSTSTELEIAVTGAETDDKESATLSPEHLSMIAGGQCTTNSI